MVSFTALITIVLLAAVVVGPLGVVVRLASRTLYAHAQQHHFRVYRAGFIRDLRAALARPVGTPRLALDTGGIAWELLSGFVTAPSSTATALTMSTGDSLAVRSAPLDKVVNLVQVWFDSQTAGVGRIKSPKMHDNVQGIRLKTTASDTAPLLPWARAQRLYSQDLLSVDLTGSATAGDIESAALLLYYEDLPGVAGRFIGWDEVMKRGVNILTIENTLSLGTAGGWSGAEAINAEYDLMKGNTDYALIGYATDVECLAIGWKGADTGNLRIGGPGNETLRHVTAEWFKRLSIGYGVPAIPVFNSQNRAGISIDGAQDENGADPLVNSIFVELSPR